MAQDNLDIDNNLLYQIISLHEAYHRIEPQLRHLKQITTIGTDVSNRLQAYFTLKETNMVNLYVQHITNYVCIWLCTLPLKRCSSNFLLRNIWICLLV